jgi:hypothetical protein
MKNFIVTCILIVVAPITSFAKINPSDLNLGKNWDCIIRFIESDKTLHKPNYLNFNSNQGHFFSKVEGRVLPFTFEEDGLVSIDEHVQIALILNSEKGLLKGKYIGLDKTDGKIKQLANLSCN